MKGTAFLKWQSERFKYMYQHALDVLIYYAEKDMKNKYVEQIGLLVLEDGDGLCEVTSDITCGGNKDNCFEITNPLSKRKYQVAIKIEEIEGDHQ